MKQVSSYIEFPPPQKKKKKKKKTVTLSGAQWGHPGNCQEQLLFFTYRTRVSTDAQYILTVLLLDVEKMF